MVLFGDDTWSMAVAAGGKEEQQCWEMKAQRSDGCRCEVKPQQVLLRTLNQSFWVLAGTQQGSLSQNWWYPIWVWEAVGPLGKGSRFQTVCAIPVTAACQLLATAGARKPQRYWNQWYNVEKNRREKRNVARRGRGFSSCWGEAASTAANAGNGCTSVVLWDCQAQETFFLSFFPLPVNFPQKVMA